MQRVSGEGGRACATCTLNALLAGAGERSLYVRPGCCVVSHSDGPAFLVQRRSVEGKLAVYLTERIVGLPRAWTKEKSAATAIEVVGATP